MQMKRKTQVKSYSLDVLTIKKMENVLESHFANSLGASDFVRHAINDLCNRIEYSAHSESFVPETQWGVEYARGYD